MGEIWDEHDEVQNDIEKLSENEYLVQGSMSVDDFYEFFGIDEEEKDISTVNGWIMKNIDKIPEVSDTFKNGKLTACVMSVDGKRAEDIKITVEVETDATNGEEG